MLAPNTVLQSRYRIVRQLGAGGMGQVYEAVDERLDTTVALKETFFTDERLSKQFEREARLLARLHHQALPKVIDHFSENNGQFLVMGFIQGQDLFEMLQNRKEPFPVGEVLRWADQLLDALDYLHSQDPPIVHRDIKPQNLKLTSRNQIILLDFGLAKGFVGQISRVTTSGSIFGFTPNYAPLEQIHGTGTDARSDLYSLAATLYHLLTCKVPPDALSRAMALASEQPDPLQIASEVNNAVPFPVADVLQRAMATNPAKRPANANEMRAMLRDASQRQELSSSQSKGAISSQTVLGAAPTQKIQDNESSFVEETIPAPLSQGQEAISTVASPIIETATPPPPTPSTVSASIVGGDSARGQTSKRQFWVIGGQLLVLIITIVSVFIIYNYNEGGAIDFTGYEIRVLYTKKNKSQAERASERLKQLHAEVVLAETSDDGNSAYVGTITHKPGNSYDAAMIAITLNQLGIEKLTPKPMDNYREKEFLVWLVR